MGCGGRRDAAHHTQLLVSWTQRQGREKRDAGGGHGGGRCQKRDRIAVTPGMCLRARLRELGGPYSFGQKGHRPIGRIGMQGTFPSTGTEKTASWSILKRASKKTAKKGDVLTGEI